MGPLNHSPFFPFFLFSFPLYLFPYLSSVCTVLGLLCQSHTQPEHLHLDRSIHNCEIAILVFFSCSLLL
ncbi:hypothetical protein AFLA_003462 [Aspergillus flavus NRRL3357]|nr:hypothetical protein AFLA_003462 [Aspergillus flavus NRRL3357]